MARIVAFRVLSLLGLLFAGILASDDLGPEPAYCDHQSDCASVTGSDYGRPLGVPLSWLGVAAFASFFAVSLFPRSRVSRLLPAMAVTAGVVGLALVAVQVVMMGRICRFCVVVDAAGLLLAAATLGLPKSSASKSSSAMRPQPRWAWALMGIAATTGPAAWSAMQTPRPVPPEVRAVQKPDRIDIVTVTDFSCPFCRSTHWSLETLRKTDPQRYHVVRFFVPSPDDEPSMNATRAYLCAVRQHSGDKMANLLFSTEDYSPGNLRNLARAAGLNLDRFDVDWKSRSLEREISATRQWTKRERIAAFPQLWVENVQLIGEQTADELTRVVDRVSP